MNKYGACAMGAGALWGGIGLFTRGLTARGFDTWSLVAARCGLAALCFLLAALWHGPKILRIKMKDLWCFLGVGLLSLLFFTYCYFNAIALMALSTASILLYTAPAFVMIMSRLFFGDKIGGRGALALALCLGGVVLVSGTGGSISSAGLLYGLGSGLGYALLSIFSRCALNRGYHTTAINFYACAIAAAGALVFVGVRAPAALMWSSGETVLLCLGMAVVSCFFPYTLYTYSLTGIPNGKAAVMASVEPVMATLLSYAVFGESMTPLALLGAVLVLSAIAVMNLKGKKTEKAGA